ncbi:MAG: hypothetical protein CME64_10630 [Halobacteriovoraceae bacterium]|nr:hypothetical protein [Halobacteriovoraceae bacterium]|tara:strand:+ start:54965 stop:55288 length:324 start_codon:yes stop_codon:yes gene_type:complete
MNELENQVPGGFSAMVNAYLDGNLSQEKSTLVEEIVALNPEASKIFKERTAQKEELKALLPNIEISKNSLSNLKREVREVNKDLVKTNRPSIANRLSSILNTTIFEF